LELRGDGLLGLLYRAKEDSIMPIQSEITGPGGAYVILLVHLCIWFPLFFGARTIYRLKRDRAATS